MSFIEKLNTVISHWSTVSEKRSEMLFIINRLSKLLNSYIKSIG
jgi:uncharacterized coiled-coil protein SlyX